MYARALPLAIAVLTLIGTGSACLSPAEKAPDPAETAVEYIAKIRRTAGGIPHIKAANLQSLGFGTLYAMAEDNFCILAEQYLTFGAERSRHLGAAEGNLESDFFYQLLIERGAASEPLPTELEALFEGAAAGFNHYLYATTRGNRRDPRCARADWIRNVEPIDVKRVSRMDYALAYMMPIIVAAAPPETDVEEADGDDAKAPDSEAALAPDPVRVAALVEAYLEVPKQGGSNAIAIGRDASLSGRGLLLSNPHMPWDEPFQRFYPMHQTIPGRFDVIGANLIGRPRVGFGHTEHVAWTSTVSTAKRLSFYRLELDPEDPTAYLYDGQSMPLARHAVSVSVLRESGEVEQEEHVFYETHFGGLLVESPFFPWTGESAFAVKLLDAGWRGETSVADQYAAKSVRELKAVHDRDQFLPVNLVAADRGGEVLYADPGPIPNIPDALAAECGVMHGAALDGSRSTCQWRNAPGAAAPGIFAPDQLPSLFRSDYVTNSNDSYWLANPAAPIEGFPASLGSERSPRTLRTRSGLGMVEREIRQQGGMSLDALRSLALSNENYAGRLIRHDAVAFCREQDDVRLERGLVVSIVDACRILADWDLHANLDSHGALLFRQFLAHANGDKFTRRLPAAFLPAVVFDPDRPVETPSGIGQAAQSVVVESLARAVVELSAAEISLDAPLGKFQGVMRNDVRIPLHGGPEFEGVFNKIESDFRGAAGYPEVDRWSSSWILAVEFEEDGPRTYGILTYSLSENPESKHFSDQTRMFSEKRWLSLPFRDADVEEQTERAYTVRSSTLF